MSIRIVREKITLTELRETAKETFGDMVKAVVDIERRILAVGGEMHADAEAVLLKEGSKQNELWGINIYPDQPKDLRVEFSSLINIRPSDNNRSMEIKSQEIREEIERITDLLIEES